MIQPLYDKVIVKRIEVEQIIGGLVIPDNLKEKSNEGEVIAIGEGRLMQDGKVISLKLKVGDRVLFRPHTGIEIKIEGVQYIIFSEAEILGIIK